MNLQNLSNEQLDIALNVIEEAERQGINPDLALAVAFAESAFNPAALSPKGAIGVMQLMPSTAKDLGVNPEDPIENIRGGIRYLKQLGERFENDPGKVMAAYNAGPNSAFFRTGNIEDLPTETVNYLSRIMDNYGGTFPSLILSAPEEQKETPQAPSSTQAQKPSITDQAVNAAKKSLSYYDPEELETFAKIAGAGTGAVMHKPIAALAQRSIAPPTVSPPVAPSALPGVPAAPPGAPAAPLGGSASVVRTQPPLSGSAVQNYAKAFGLGVIEAGRAMDMTKQVGGVHDLTTQRRIGLQRVQDLFPNQFREDPRFGGLMTPEERPGLGPRGPTGQVGAGKPPPIVKPPGPLSRITNMFQSMAEGYSKGARGISAVASKVPIVSYPLAGANIGGESMTAFQELSKEDPDYYKAALSGLGALGTGLSLYPPTAPIGIPLATIPPLIQYFRDQPPDDQRTMNIGAP